jgi:hypothetical protein
MNPVTLQLAVRPRKFRVRQFNPLQAPDAADWVFLLEGTD